PAVFAQLLQFLTIPVSEMFRDPAYFLALRQQVVPVLHTYPSVKIWVAGCSTGEEAWSMAIMLREEGLLKRTQIYATDINPASIEKARQGIFPLEAVKGYTANYQRAGGSSAFSDYYTAAYGAAKFDPSLCADVIFADHSLATDSVFAETQLVSCRNVLIYFNRNLQDRALGLFHESLCHRGFLGLGSKESIDFSAYAMRFDTLAKAERIFRKAS
ncbi:MAG: protein-glutamate O-methyltransferase CheR, partial [Variovorax sp.]|nr:protein-glutamate O-methyltransferase CheR [Variovorax sp.]